MPRIMLLEPDRQFAKYIVEYLGSGGYEVQAFVDPQAAVMAADESLPGLIITNIYLAGRSGIEFLYELRSYPEWQKIPVIAYGDLSAEDRVAFQGAMDELGIKVYLPKHSLSLKNLKISADEQLRPLNV